MTPPSSPDAFSAMNTAPLSAPLQPIPDYRVAQFARGVASRVRTALAAGETEQVVYDAIRDERLALASALDTPNVRAIFARSYRAHYNALSPVLACSLQASINDTGEVIDHRINDARTLATLVQMPDFLSLVQAELARNEPVTPYHLPPEKIDEMVERFAEDTAPRGVDAKIHARQSMDGHRLGHLALAETFRPHGMLQTVLQQALAEQLPAGDPALPARLSVDWLDAREKPARATSAALEENGVVAQAVMQRIDAANRRSFQQRLAEETSPTVGFAHGA